MSKRPRDEGTVNSIKAILGDVPDETIYTLLHRTNNNIEAAVNLYFTDPPQPPTKQPQQPQQQQIRSSTSNARPKLTKLRYYIGDIVISGWSLIKDIGVIKEGQQITIVRDKVSGNNAHKIVRFSVNGREVGRLPKDIANYMSTLIDQKVCEFEGTVVYAPRILSVGDDVILSIKCYLSPSALNTASFSSSGVPSKKQRVAQYDIPILKKLALLQMFKNLGLTPARSTMQDMNDANTSLDMVIKSITSKDGDPIVDEGPTADMSDIDDEDKKEVTDDQLNTIYEKAQIFDAQIKPMDPPKTLTLSLKEYQKRALAWMSAKESNSYDDVNDIDMRAMHPLWEEYTFPGEFVDEHRFFYFNPYSGELSLEFPEANKQETGGILADEMGLGKTIEILSIIHANRYDPKTCSPPPHKTDKSPTTLIICPMSLLAQWRDEILRASEPGSIKVELFYGDERSKKSMHHLCKWDGTAPDVLITTYGVAMADWSKMQNPSCQEISPLFDIDFWRVVLDEAHQIKNRLSKTSLACKDIRAKRRWAVTGTPIQNKLDDLYSLVRFLHHAPWSNHTFWKTFITVPFEKKDTRALSAVQNVLEPIVLRRTKAMRDDKGQLMVPLPPKTVNIEYLSFSREEQDIYDAIYNDSQMKFSYFSASGKIGKNYASILQLLTRLRQICCHPHLAIQSKESQKQEINSGSGRVMSLEDLIAKKSFEDFSQNSGSVEGGSSYELSVLQNMLAQQEGSASPMSISASSPSQDPNIPPIIDECPICFETVDSVICMPCMHMACRPCVMDYFQKKEDEGEPGECPTCRRTPIDQSELLEFSKHNTTSDTKVRYEIQKAIGGFKRSTKMIALVRHLRQYAEEKRKTVVFSQFTSFLDLLEEGLKLESIKYTRLDGSQSQAQREKVLSSFTSPEGPGVLLISLRAGGIGLNLTCANRIIMMDPWWNFAVEAQAIDRVHRLGQTEDVTVTRFIMRDSVEEKILAIQNRKHVMVNELYMSNNDSKTRRLEELQILFGAGS